MEVTSTPTSRVRRLATLTLLVALLTLGLSPVVYSGLRPIVFTEGGVNWTVAGAVVAASGLVVVERRSRRRFPRLSLWFAGALVLALVASVVLAITLPVLTGRTAEARLAIGAVVLFVFVTTGFAELRALQWLWDRAEPEVDRFGEAIWPGIQKLRPTVVGFAIAYLMAVLWFGYLYDTLYWLDRPGAFAHAEGPTLGAFLYFSLLTITTLGYTGMLPTSVWTQVAVSAEVVFGMAWTLIVFAALLLEVEVRLPRVTEPTAAADPVAVELAELKKEVRELRAVIEVLTAERRRSSLRGLWAWLRRLPRR